MSFAPPPELDRGSVVSNASTAIIEDATGDDAYARRIRLSQMNVQESAPTKAAEVMFKSSVPPPPPPPTDLQPSTYPPPPLLEPPRATSSQPAPSISRAPVRYNLPPAPADIPKSEAELESALEREQEQETVEQEEADDDAPRSLRPGQRGFAERLMSKYGWTKGSGLGASGSGIVNALRVQIEKQKKKPDSEGGGFVGPGGRGKIIGGKKKGGNDAEAEGGKFGVMSEVVVLRGMVDGMDLDAELDDGGLMQEIGEECGDKVRSSYCESRNPMLMINSMVGSSVCSSTVAVLPAHPSSSSSQASYRLYV